VNARAGGVVIAAVAISGFFLSGIPQNGFVRWAVIALLAATAGVLGAALWPIQWHDAPDPRRYAALASSPPAAMHQAALATLLDAYQRNLEPLQRKSRLANIGAAIEFVALAVLVIGRAAWG
jgi:hypothetical protein